MSKKKIYISYDQLILILINFIFHFIRVIIWVLDHSSFRFIFILVSLLLNYGKLDSMTWKLVKLYHEPLHESLEENMWLEANFGAFMFCSSTFGFLNIIIWTFSHGEKLFKIELSFQKHLESSNSHVGIKSWPKYWDNVKATIFMRMITTRDNFEELTESICKW